LMDRVVGLLWDRKIVTGPTWIVEPIY